MTTEQIINRARMLARVSDLSSSDVDCVELINMAIEDIAHQVGGIYRRKVTQGAYEFSLAPGSFLLLDAVPLIVTADGLDEVGAMDVCNSFNLLNPGYILSFNEWTLVFRLTMPVVGNYVLEHTGGLSATQYLFGTTLLDTEDSDTIVGTAPTENHFSIRLDEIFTDVQGVKFAGRMLTQMNLELAESKGTPSNFMLRDDRIYLTPPPQQNELVIVEYLGTPVPVGMVEVENDFPLVDLSDSVYKPGPISVPASLHNLLVYFLASKLAAQEHEYGVSDRMLAMYNRDIGRYIVEKANANPDIGFGVLY